MLTVRAKLAAKPLKWQALSVLFRTVGRLSDGIALGFQYGFDSGEMLDYVYENRASGRFLIGKLIDRSYLDAIGWRAIRSRKTRLQAILLELLKARPDRPETTTILDIAAGPGRYLQEICQLSRSQAELNRIAVICRDLDPVGLEQGRRRAAALGLIDIRYEQGDACDPISLATVQPQPDIVIASGIYELLPPPLIRQSMEGVYRILPSGGHFIFTTQVNHPQLELIANVLVNRAGEPWVMVCHSLDEVEGWAREVGFRVIQSEIESVGLFGITVCLKEATNQSGKLDGWPNTVFPRPIVG